MRYSKGITWIDECRIPYSIDDVAFAGGRTASFFQQEFTSLGNGSVEYADSGNGRFVPNLLVCDDVLNDGSFNKKTNSKITSAGLGRGVIGNHDGRKKLSKANENLLMLRTIGDSGSKSRFYNLDLWFEQMIGNL